MISSTVFLLKTLLNSKQLSLNLLRSAFVLKQQKPELVALASCRRTLGYTTGLACIGLVGSLLVTSSARALPAAGEVQAGPAQINQVNPDQLNIIQQSDRAVINWQSFSVGEQQQVNFQQPSATSATLNRVTGNDRSDITGRVTANGAVMLVNPNGILFGSTAAVDVAGLMATTLDIRNQDFLNGQYSFSAVPGMPAAMVENQGQITVKEGGLAALVAPGVANNGVINARLGKVVLASGTKATLDLTGDGLVSLAVDPTLAQQLQGADGKPLSSLVNHSGQINADGGVVTLSARAGKAVVDNTINVSGVIQARSVAERNGKIVLSGEDQGVVAVSGTLDASGKETGQTGGKVNVLGNLVGLFDNAKVDVSGDAGGGTALVGGDYQGKGTVANAQQTYVSNHATINADAVSNGDGGKAVVWSDNTTRFNGNISARGGSTAGNGGNIEVSGKQLLDFQGMVYANAPYGLPGTLLLDPKNIIIADSDKQRAAYISDTFIYWDGANYRGGGTASNQAAMDAAFGAGNWENLSLASTEANPFTTGTGNDYKFIFLDGSDSQAVNLSNYLATNSASIDAWVKQGGHLIVNSAPNVGGNFSMGFGVTLNYPNYAGSVVAANPSHPIFDGSTGTAFSGNYFSHAAVSGGGITPIISNDSGGIVLGEKPVEQGLALFGGMTTANYHEPQPQASNLRTNIIKYASAPTPLSGNEVFTQNPATTATIAPSQITKITNAGTAVVLQANNDIKVNSAITTSAGGNGGALTLQAGRSILINANITTDNGNLTLAANDANAIAAQRDPGAAAITMAPGTTLNAGSGKVSISLNQGTETENNPSGNVTIGSITAKQIDIVNAGGITTQNDIITNGGDINLTSSGGTINTTAGRLNTSGSTGGNITLSALGNIYSGTLATYAGAGSTGNGGSIILNSTKGEIDTTAGILNSTTTSGKGGAIALTAAGNISTGDVLTYATDSRATAATSISLAKPELLTPREEI
ncbi:filamentous hemagglutinin N-terminal domain-containing protein [Gloeocapsopsis dulcis]|uniref:Filamentous haemagglutinin FhaB/tRNA nuclease CdiA-like TPS domain-containing protein n=1 Tax=Gloeocapsopsis dulcis AAB1 = 1H9 TaxID=1433147 RepID=A0A6N8FUI7_9CHRO|nr:filamentous hemagglutinin N-terminal domain-containing protein [Gloeocapsopsis dulcis]MUL36519.1 hypothetical protein [Gloeocapsopsis dulcis AAB1 = 1H9]WNN87804.1 filamentous hemagglutinin N-terminal domain-containing protein [Gloeocapsopsis dulcis]